LKGRYDEDQNPRPADREHLNEAARSLYRAEIAALTERLNRFVPAAQPQLRLPDIKFNRRIGTYAGQPYSVTGDLLSAAAYAVHLTEVLPQPADMAYVEELTQTSDWLAPKKEDLRFKI
jgi:hypothetical protein